MGKPLIPESTRISQINSKPGISFVRWDGEYKNCKSKAVCKCSIHGYEWSASVTDLVNRGQGCPQCGGKRKWTAEDRVAQINAIKDIRFVRWLNEYNGRASKAVCRCEVDGHEWSAYVGDLLGKGSGCPMCKRSKNGDRCRIPAEDRCSQIDSLQNIEFVRWDGVYRNSYSKAVCRCSTCGIEWSSSVYSLLGGHGCPSCARGGYDKAKIGTLYALRSKCGTMMKIGISNNYKKRHADLKRATPFEWDCIELLHGDGWWISELEEEFHRRASRVEFSMPFNGHTEWLAWDPMVREWFDTERLKGQEPLC